jgi:DNA-binding transcriptional ArsR family regulator
VGLGLALTDDITDPRLAKALAHPLRIEILRRLDERTASPSEIAVEVGAPLTHVSYHVRKLASLGLIELVRKRPKRGVVEHYYSARKRAKVSDKAWRDTPRIVKRALAEASVQQGTEHVLASAQAGGFDKSGAHYSRTNMTVDKRGWKEAVKVFEDALSKIEKIEADAAARMKSDPHAERELATAMLMLFEPPEGTAPASEPAAAKGRPRRARAKATA